MAADSKTTCLIDTQLANSGGSAGGVVGSDLAKIWTLTVIFFEGSAVRTAARRAPLFGHLLTGVSFSFSLLYIVQFAVAWGVGVVAKEVNRRLYKHCFNLWDLCQIRAHLTSGQLIWG